MRSWTMHLDTLTFTKCDRCGKRRLVAQYMEMYGDECWWHECVWCAFETIAKYNAICYGQEAIWAKEWSGAVLGKGIEA